MKIAISGSSGLIGSSLREKFMQQGHEILSLGRRELYSDPEKLANLLEGTNVVIHLAGANIQTRWTRKKKEIIYNSRIVTTRNIVNAFKKMANKPGVFICASAATIFPEKGKHTEKSKARDSSFLGTLSIDWEKEASFAPPEVRTISLRITMVVTAKGGALKTMLPPFRLWLGGKVGSGNQIMSWIHIDDLAEAVEFIIFNNQVSGPVIAASPFPVTNKKFSSILAKTIGRPSWNRVPPLLLYLLYGKGAKVVIRGLNVYPEKLLDNGFNFKFPHIKQALEKELK